MITVNLKVVQEEKYGYAVHFDAEFEGLSSQQKLDLLQDAVYELNKKWVEVDEKMFSDEIKQMRALEQNIKREIENVLGIDVKVKLVEPKSIERSEGKAKRVIDKRKI